MFIVRFDLRAPGKDAAERAALYRTTIEMAEWIDDNGCLSIVLSEHHGADDGFLPSPLTLAAAVAAVTTRTHITVAAALLPTYEPVRLAEDLITLDHISEGRVLVVLGLGYRPSEYELYGVDYSKRAAVADAKLERVLELLRDAGAESAAPRITPAPYTSPIPHLAWGGRTKAAARRGGRNGIGFFGQTDDPALGVAYEEAARSRGHSPGLCVLPSPEVPFIVFVNDDVDAGWQEVGPSMLADAVSYHEWNAAAGIVDGLASLSRSSTIEDLRREQGAHRVVDSEAALALIRQHGYVGLHPLCGGLDPEVAWPYLRRAFAVVRDDG